MPLNQSFPGHSALATFADIRRDLEGSVVRDAAGKMRAGVFPAHFNALVTGRSDMKVAIADFRAVIDRGGAIFMANVGADTSVTLDAAPAANRRIDLIYVTQQSTTLGDAASLPIFGFVKGTASATPVAPSLPANLSTALPLATVEIPAGATTTASAGVVITQVFPYTAMAGGVVAVRSSVELAAWAPADGLKALNLADAREYVRDGGAWRGGTVTLATASGWTADGTYSPTASRDGWQVSLGGRTLGPITAGTILVLPIGFRPADPLAFYICDRGSAAAIARVTVASDGTVTHSSTAGATAGTAVALSGITFRAAKIA